MTAPRQSASVLAPRLRLALCCTLLLLSAMLCIAVAQAAEETALAPAERAALAEQQRIDSQTGAFDSPLLIRLRSRISPSWPGPRGEPSVTERRYCPDILDPTGRPVTPPFC